MQQLTTISQSKHICKFQLRVLRARLTYEKSRLRGSRVFIAVGWLESAAVLTALVIGLSILIREINDITFIFVRVFDQFLIIIVTWHAPNR